MRFAFVTCVQLGMACVEEIYRVGGRLDLLITLKDELARDKSGRIYIDEFAEREGIAVLKVGNVNDPGAVWAVREREIDWLFIIGWSQIALAPMLRAPRRGVLGMHPTLLPVGRGRAAIPWALLKGLPETGVTLFQLDEGVDTGPILAQERLSIASDETATTLYRRVAEAHRTLIRRIWPDLTQDLISPILQDESRASVWPGRTPEEGRITSLMTVAEAERLVRATTHPYPGAFWEDGGTVIRIWHGVIGNPDEPPPARALRLAVLDGVFDALDYEG